MVTCRLSSWNREYTWATVDNAHEGVRQYIEKEMVLVHFQVSVICNKLRHFPHTCTLLLQWFSYLGIPRVKDAVIYPSDPPPLPTPPPKKKVTKPRIICENCVFYLNMNKISFYKLFMLHYAYLIERYLCSMTFSTFIRHHLQFCSRSSPNIALGTNSLA